MRLIPPLEMSITKVPANGGMEISLIQASEKYCSLIVNNFIQIFTEKDLYLKLVKPNKLNFIDYRYGGKDKGTSVYDNVIDIRYQFSNLSCCEMENIFTNLIVDKVHYSMMDIDGLCFFSFTKEECSANNKELHEINVEFVKTGISEYLLLSGYGEDYRDTNLYTFGIDCYRELEKLLIIGTDNDNRHVDHKVFAATYDHKRAMVLRIEYLQNHLSKDLSKYIEDYMRVIDTMNRIIRKIIKGNISRNASQFNLCISLLEKVKKKEVKILEGLLTEL